VKLGVQIQLLLDETAEVRAEDTGLMSRGAWAVISDVRELAESYTDSDNLLGKVFHVLTD
jgi:hypothetical protein